MNNIAPLRSAVKSKALPAAVFDYHDEQGRTLFRVRLEPGRDGSLPRRTIKGKAPSKLIPYRLPKLKTAAECRRPMIVVPTEADVEAIEALGLAATCVPPGGWSNELALYFDGLEEAFVLLPGLAVSFEQLTRAARYLSARVPVSTVTLRGTADVASIAGRVSMREFVALLSEARKFDPDDTSTYPRPETPPASGTVLDGEAGTPSGPVIVRATEIAERALDWWWLGRLPRGLVSVLSGDPDVGKSLILIDLAARITTGRGAPGTQQQGEPQNVLFLGREDDLSATIKPRLRAAGADLARSFFYAGEVDTEGCLHPPLLPECVSSLERLVKEHDIAAVFVEAVVGHLGRGTAGRRLNRNDDQDVREALDPLAAMVERTGIVCVLTRHLNKKGEQSALQRGAGAGAWSQVARSEILVVKDQDAPPVEPDEEEWRAFSISKGNLAPRAMKRTIRFRPVTSAAPPYHPVIEWGEETDATADDLLRRHPEEDATTQTRAVRWLRELLEQGPVTAARIKELSEAAGFRPATLKRARADLKKQLGITGTWGDRRGGRDGEWVLSLPDGKTDVAAA